MAPLQNTRLLYCYNFPGVWCIREGVAAPELRDKSLLLNQDCLSKNNGRRGEGRMAGCLTITEGQGFARSLDERVGGVGMGIEFIQHLPRGKHNCQECSGDYEEVK